MISIRQSEMNKDNMMSLNFDKTHSVASPGQSYFFCLIPKKINYIGSDQLYLTYESYFKFALFKGQQKLDQTKERILARFNQYAKVQIYFLIPNYVPGRKTTFYLKLFFNDKGLTQKVGQLTIDANRLVKAYNQQKCTYIPQTCELSSNYQLESDLDKIVTDIRNLAKIQTISESKSQPQKQLAFSPLPIIKRKNKFSIISQKDAQLQQSRIKPKGQKQNGQREAQNSPTKSSPDEKSFLRLEKVEVKSIRQEDEFFDFDFQKTKKKKRQVKPGKIDFDQQSQGVSINLPSSAIRKSLVKHNNGGLKESRNMKQIEAQIKRKAESNKKTEQTQTLKYYIKMVIFFILSLLMIYNAMVPNKKYNSKKMRKR